jgi:hypothetical protein
MGRYVSVRAAKGMSSAEIAETVEGVIAWMRSPEGRQRLAEAGAQAERVIAELQEKRRVDPEDLRRPVTIERRVGFDTHSGG